MKSSCFLVLLILTVLVSSETFSGALKNRSLEPSLAEIVARFLSSFSIASSRSGVGAESTLPSEPAPQFRARPVRMGLVERVSRPGGERRLETPALPRDPLKPQSITSQPLRIFDGPSTGKRGRSLKEVEVQGVKIIVGERVPDAPEDKFFTWRNARVIKGMLVPNSNSNQEKSKGRE